MNSNPLAIVTGGSSGIGKAVCTRLLTENYQIINADVIPPDTIPPGNYRYIQCDVTQRDDIQKLSILIQKSGNPEVLVLNAGRGIHEKLREGDPEKWVEVINVNVCGTLRVLRAVLPFMKTGNVIFMSSVASGNAHPYGGIYASSKSAVDTIAETLRLEEQPDLSVTVISPGVVDTPFFDNMLSGNHSVESIGYGAVSPGEVADAVAYVIKQKKGTSINNITIRPSSQPF